MPWGFYFWGWVRLQVKGVVVLRDILKLLGFEGD
jgi:hypothetical protein